MSDAPSLAEALSGLATVPVTKGPKCGVGIILAELERTDPPGHAALVEVIDNPAIPAGLIADTLVRGGHQITDQTVRRHRKRERSSGCACPR